MQTLLAYCVADESSVKFDDPACILVQTQARNIVTYLGPRGRRGGYRDQGSPWVLLDEGKGRVIVEPPDDRTIWRRNHH